MKGFTARVPRAAVPLTIVFLGAVTLGCHKGDGGSIRVNLHHQDPAALVRPPDPSDPRERFAATDPLGFLRMCREHYFETISDYRCRFHKLERSRRGLSAEQEMEVSFRENPYSVDMRWVRNPGLAKRINYVAGRWNDKGRELALIEPAGFLGLFVPGGVRRDIHGWAARSAARRTIDQFGFSNTLAFIIKYCEMAQDHPDYDLQYVGRGRFDGRDTYVFERRLPYTEPDKPYPNRLLIIHVDCEWLVPTACYGYADDERETLLGRYTTSSVEINVGLTARDF